MHMLRLGYQGRELLETAGSASRCASTSAGGSSRFAAAKCPSTTS
jgi:hypothetical protein